MRFLKLLCSLLLVKVIDFPFTCMLLCSCLRVCTPNAHCLCCSLTLVHVVVEVSHHYGSVVLAAQLPVLLSIPLKREFLMKLWDRGHNNGWQR